jgi:hypothetical protein
MDPTQNTTDKTGKIRFDYLFSYWIFAWFLIFYFVDANTTSGKWIHKYLNPVFALYIGFLEELVTFVYLLVINPQMNYIVKMLAMMTLIKLFPLYLLRNYPIHWKNDIMVFLFFFGIYNLYLFFNDTNVYDVYKRTFISFKEGTNKTPLFSLMDSLYARMHF